MYMLLYAAAYILESSKKRNIINENVYDGGALLMLLVIAECNFTRRNFYYKLFQINLLEQTANKTLQ